MGNSKTTKVWEEKCIIPTYKACTPEKSPLFIERRAYQGSTGKVYPLPVTEKISDTKEPVAYKAVFLENDYLKVMILPELGGRIQRALDKTNNYDFVYYNEVIKPALVGLTGPWISGGIEFNWPQHHRPSTYSPVDYTIKQNDDGSATVYLSETDKMYGTKGMAAISLYPDKAYIEIKGKLYNPTDLPQTFLWWANPAVPVNDDTYSVFPPDVNAVMDHGKRAVSTFPIATGEYYKCDYSAGVDISRYKNIKVPTSYMAAHSDFDFIGNYDEGKEAGLLHVADHHVSPGKKQWTWGNSDFGRSWDRNLTDKNGPYIELMTGVFTDNQPDFSWLKPQEEKNFVQYFMPYKGIGKVSNATKEAMLSIAEASDGKAVLKVYATSIYPAASIRVAAGDKVLYEVTADLSPEKHFQAEFALPVPINECHVTIRFKDKVLVEYKVYKKTLQPIPEPAERLMEPQKLKSLEELYLAGMHLEQYRHATFEPADYYQEGLRRDPTDIRLNNAYGMLLFRRGHAKESIAYFRAAIKKQTWRNPNPYCGQEYFNLGLALEADGQDAKAFDAFFKATWSAETQGAGFYWLSCLAARNGSFEQALDFAKNSLVRNWHNMDARTLHAAILRHLSKNNKDFLQESLQIDPLCMGCLYEAALQDGNLDKWKEAMRPEAHNYLILALDYIKAGFYTDALNILQNCTEANPLVLYYQGYAYHLAGKEDAAKEYFQKAEDQSADYCFPSHLDEIKILSSAVSALPQAPTAHYLLGNLLYDKKQYKQAVSHWEQAINENPSLTMAYRNLSIAYYNKQKDADKALVMIKKACELEPEYPRFGLELDQLAAKLNTSNEKRLAVLAEHKEIIMKRDDLCLRYITMLNCIGNYDEALDMIKSCRFHPWEGGEGKVAAQYKFALTQKAILLLKENKAEMALPLLQATITYPENLGEGKLPNVPDNEAYYYMGRAYQMLHEEEKAKEAFLMAASGPQKPEPVLYYNDQPSDFIFYQGLANEALGNTSAALRAYHQLIIYGEKHVFDKVGYDFFAVSLPEIEVYQDDIQLRNEQYCNYLRALGDLGINKNDEAKKLLDGIISKQKDYQEAIAHLNFARI